MAIAKNAMGGSGRGVNRKAVQSKGGKTTPKAGRKILDSRATASNKLSKLNSKGVSGVGKTANKVTASGKLVKTTKKSGYDMTINFKRDAKTGSNSISPRKPSVPNKVKTQGAKTMSQGMKYSAGRKGK